MSARPCATGWKPTGGIAWWRWITPQTWTGCGRSARDAGRSQEFDHQHVAGSVSFGGVQVPVKVFSVG